MDYRCYFFGYLIRNYLQLWFIILFYLCFFVVSEIENTTIIELGLTKRKYNGKVYSNQVFCTQKLVKSIGRVWSTAYVC